MNNKKLPYCISILFCLIIGSAVAQDSQTVFQKVQAYNDSGWDLMNESKYEDAILEFSQAVELDSSDWNSLVGRATCKLILGQFEAAEKDVIKVLPPVSNKSEIYFLAGNIYFQLKDYNNAIANYTLASEENRINRYTGNEKDILFNRGNAYLLLEDYADAVDDFSTAIYLGDNSSEIFHKMATAFYGMGDLQGTCKSYSAVQELDTTIFDKKLSGYCEGYQLTENDTIYYVEHKVSTDTSEIYDNVDISPQPVAGMYDFYRHLSKNLIYPESARKLRIEGKVFVQFIVNRDGSISDVRAIKGIGKECDREAERVVRNSPPWYPGKKDGEPVRVRMILPITFTL